MWATFYIEKLQKGETVEFRPRGNSMKPKINSGDLVVVAPIPPETEIKDGDILLCKVKGRQFLHLVSAVQGNRIQISNNHGHVNGWISANAVYGRMIENKGKDSHEKK